MEDRLEQALNYLEQLIEAIKDISDNEGIYSPKYGYTYLREIENFIENK